MYRLPTDGRPDTVGRRAARTPSDTVPPPVRPAGASAAPKCVIINNNIRYYRLNRVLSSLQVHDDAGGGDCDLRRAAAQHYFITNNNNIYISI